MAESGQPLDVEKLRQLLAYLLDHNDHHIEDLDSWVRRIEDAGREDIAAELRKAVELTGTIGTHFEAAAAKLAELDSEHTEARGP